MSSPLRQPVRTVNDSWINTAVWVIIRPPNGNWERATITNHQPYDSITKEKQFVVLTENGDTHIIKSVSVDKYNLEFQWVKKRSVEMCAADSVSDMTSLSFLNEPEMLECLRLRFASKTIYTSIGPILMAINPFERLSLYSRDVLLSYYTASPAESKKLAPHVYQISDRVYRKMFIDKFDPDKRENQSILVNGESGAGKTESTKTVLQYLATVSSMVAADVGADSKVLDFEMLIIAASPITESFGNAKTSRNNNSSRFGKFIELGFVPDGFIERAKIRTYLLETVRVTCQMPGERNYHVIYECFAGLGREQRQQWGLTSPQDFSYSNQSGEFNRHDGESDSDNFDKLQCAMAQIGLSGSTQFDVFQAVVAVLHIGNLSFNDSSVAGDDMAMFAPNCRKHVVAICQLLSITEEDLLTAVTKRSMEIAGSSIQKYLNVDSAVVARDTFARTLYDTIFKWMIQAVNQSFVVTSIDESASFVGVLDIFGFEYFKNNSFEQLCINYANEKLQDHFNYAVFRSEQEVYKEEGIEWTFVDYPDNSERLGLFEHKFTGIFALCNEQLKLPKPTDQKLAKELYSKCEMKPFFSVTKKEQAVCEFVVQHFACDVKYCSIGFLEKNRSDIAPEISACFRNSGSDFVKSFCALSGNIPVVDTSAGTITMTKTHRSVGKKTSTVSSQFCRQLQELVDKIRSTRSHFIRCIKPNNSLTASTFDDNMVISQLRCGGALGAIQVFRAGFPNRMDFATFVSRFAGFVIVCGNNAVTRDVYKALSEARRTGLERRWRTAAAKLIDIVALTDTILHIIDNTSPDEAINIYEGLQLGKTQVFLRAPTYEFLENLQVRALTMVVRNTQRRFRAQHFALKHSVRAAIDAVLWFFDHKKRMAVQCVSATILLQRRARIYLLVRARKKIMAGLTRFKSHFRGYKARVYVRLFKYNSATTIQTAYRRFTVYKRYCAMCQGVVLLQKIARGYYAKSVAMLRLLSIIQIQAVWRGSVTRTHSELTGMMYNLKKKRELIAARRKEAANDDATFGSKARGAISGQQKLLSMENKSLKKKVIALEREVEAFRQKLFITNSTRYSDEITRLNQEVDMLRNQQESSSPDAAQDGMVPYSGELTGLRMESELSQQLCEYGDFSEPSAYEIAQLREELARSKSEAADYKSALYDIQQQRAVDELLLSPPVNSATVNQASTTDAATANTASLQKRIQELEIENESLLDMVYESFERNIKTLADYNHTLREKNNACQLAKMRDDKARTKQFERAMSLTGIGNLHTKQHDAAERRRQFAEIGSSKSIKSISGSGVYSTCSTSTGDLLRKQCRWLVQLSTHVPSFHMENDDVVFKIDIEAIEGPRQSVKWTVCRVYQEFRGLRNCIGLREHKIDEFFPESVKDEENTPPTESDLEERRRKLDEYLSLLCTSPMYANR